MHVFSSTLSPFDGVRLRCLCLHCPQADLLLGLSFLNNSKALACHLMWKYLVSQRQGSCLAGGEGLDLLYRQDPRVPTWAFSSAVTVTQSVKPPLYHKSVWELWWTRQPAGQHCIAGLGEMSWFPAKAGPVLQTRSSRDELFWRSIFLLRLFIYKCSMTSVLSPSLKGSWDYELLEVPPTHLFLLESSPAAQKA